MGVDNCRAAQCPGLAIGTTVIIIKGNIATIGDKIETDAGDIGPGLQRQCREILSGAGQPGDVNIKCSTGGDIERSRSASGGIPVPVSELIGNLVVGVNGIGHDIFFLPVTAPDSVAISSYQ